MTHRLWLQICDEGIEIASTLISDEKKNDHKKHHSLGSVVLKEII